MEQTDQKQTHTLMIHNQSMTKEARIHNKEKTVSSISGAKKTGQLHIDEIRTFSDTIYKNTLKMKT